jgi:hypothetical protein
MHEKFRDTPFYDPEEGADKALKLGDFADAKDYLEDLLQTFPHPDKYHHAMLKHTALPLYEMAYGITPQQCEAVYKEANTAYGLIGELLQEELSTFSSSFHSEVGRISELTFFALNLRRLFSDETSAVMLPTPAADDKKGIDFYMSPVGTKRVTDGHAYQIKTQAPREVRKQYENSRITLISMNDIDQYAAKPDHPESLARTILRELRLPLYDGKKADFEEYNDVADRNRLDQASSLIEKIASGSITNATARALTRTSIRGFEFDAA